MNNQRRKALQAILTDLDRLAGELSVIFDSVQAVRDEEQEAFDNLPESLQEGERGYFMQDAIDALDEVTFEDAFDEARDAIERAMA